MPSPFFFGSFQRRVRIMACSFPDPPAAVHWRIASCVGAGQPPIYSSTRRLRSGLVPRLGKDIMERFVFFCVLLLAFAAPAAVFAEGKRPMTIDDLFRFKRVSDPQLDRHGQNVAYVVATVDLNANSSSSSIWLAPTEGKGEPRQLTNTTKKDKHPRWSPDGKQVLFESNRSGGSQLWVIDVGGGEARQLTTISTEASDGQWSPDGKWIAFVSTVYPEYSDKPFKESDELNKKRKEEAEKNPVKARVFKR